MSRLIRLGAFLLVSALGLPSGVAAQDKDKKEKGDANRVTAAEIATKPDVRNAEEVIRMLRPAWLRPCRPTTAGVTREKALEPVVYVDEIRDRMTLREVRADEVTELKFMPGSRALALYGDGHECGAIFVVRRKP
jgi:hypothetical protein